MADDAPAALGRGRGARLLLLHLTALTRVDDPPTPFERVADEVGPELARLLVGALVGPRTDRSRLAA
jgi:hypothetical protein